tara:strand:+ start:342 stop:608 length:267 start_codon:yes stop_codon:yes gene_type:complete
MNTMTQDLLREQQLAELATAIKHHDHYYQMSDDHRVFLSGTAEKEAILERLEEVFDKKSEQLEFWNEHAPEGKGYVKGYINELKSQGN